MRIVFMSFLLFAVSNLVSAQTTLPYTFAPGTVAKASEVNANFQALLTAINKLEGPVTPAGVAGNYVLTGLSLNMSSTAQAGTSSNNARVEHSAVNATAVFNSDGTFAFPQESSSGSAMAFDFFKSGANVINATATTQLSTSPPSGGGTWSLSGNTLTITLNGGGGGTFTAAAGGKIFIGVDSSPDSKSQDLHFLIRTN